LATIATYEVQVADLLHDALQQYWSLTQLDRYINEARTKLVMDTGCLRTLQTAYLTQGQEAITFGQVTGALISVPGTGYVAGQALPFSGGGGSGVAATLGVTAGAVTSISFTNFGSGYSSAPTAFAANGSGSLSSVTVVGPGAGYTSAPLITISGGGGALAQANASMGLYTGSLVTGSSYSVGDVMTLAAGTYTRPAKFLVTAIGCGGVISIFYIIDGGDYSVLPGTNSPLTTVSGTGSGSTVTPQTWYVSSVTPVTGGSGYTSAPTATATLGGASAQAILSTAITSVNAATIIAGVINVNTYDVLGVNLVWGNQRIPLDWKPWSEFSAAARTWVGLQRRPVMWAVYGDNQIYVGPIPDQTYTIEVDTVILPTAIAGSTIDPIPAVAQSPIAYYAARVAKFNDQRFGEAAMFMEQYNLRMADVTNAYTRRLPSTTGG
jgi:hypothetical protein